MQLSVRGKQLDVGEALRTHVNESLSHILDKYFGDAIVVDVTLAREASGYRSFVSAHVGRGIQLQAQGEAGDPYISFDTAADHLAKRLRRYKRRLRDHHKEPETESLSAQQYVISHETESDEDAVAEAGAPVVVAEMTTQIPSLTVSEAVMRMDLADLPALLFRNRSHSGLNMVYRRSDGHVGWIDPQGNQGQ
jgi:ribosomal subunit interface protein